MTLENVFERAGSDVVTKLQRLYVAALHEAARAPGCFCYRDKCVSFWKNTAEEIPLPDPFELEISRGLNDPGTHRAELKDKLDSVNLHFLGHEHIDDEIEPLSGETLNRARADFEAEFPEQAGDEDSLENRMVELQIGIEQEGGANDEDDGAARELDPAHDVGMSDM